MRRLARIDLVLVLLIAAVALVVAVATLNGSNSLEARTQRLASSLRCPTCAGASIADSPAVIAAQMRAILVERLNAGDGDQDVRDYFVARYGRWILLDPPTSGIDSLLWLVPAVVIAAGAGLVVVQVRPRSATVGAPHTRGASRGLVTLGATAFIAAALVIPAVIALAPRRAGSELTGGSVTTPTTDVETARARAAAAPADPAALVDLGDALLAEGLGSAAAEQYRAALERDPRSVRALLGVAVILLDADRPDAAVNALDRVLASEPNQPDALVTRGLAWLRIDGALSARARDDLVKFMAIAAGDPRAAMVTDLLAGGASPS